MAKNFTNSQPFTPPLTSRFSQNPAPEIAFPDKHILNPADISLLDEVEKK